ncbi:MAG: sugar ABC transporter permease [Bacilli bacterium]|jgi:arabinogalactan oligomer/maltooligosaccharide transport system permease protein|nr:sugar ABC transporter permease [Bacilli bacterium]MCH4235617.1 sugar ABC transporter permease [Bacilli bacterium]
MKEQNVKKLGFFPWIGQSILDSIIKFGKWLLDFLWTIIKAFINIFVFAYKIIVKVGKAIGLWFYNYVNRFIKGNFKTRLSYLFVGFGHITNGQVVKGVVLLILEALFIVFMVLPQGGAYWLSQINIFGQTGGDGMRWIGDIGTTYNYVVISKFGEVLITKTTGFASNSMLVMLYSIATLLIIAAFFALYTYGISAAYSLQKKKEEGGHIASFKEETHALLDRRFHVTVLSLPTLTILTFTILPLIFMILLAFTNASLFYFPPSRRFAWTGLDTFGQLFGGNAGYSFAIGEIFKWTILWAVLATFTNYIGGMILALLINKKGIKFKKIWRTLFIISIAIPQFISLSMMAKFLAKDGPIFNALDALGWMKPINIFNDTRSARTSVVLINMWIGMPYTMLITSGILMNIPADLYESARIDGAGPVTQFFKITLPYMLFVTGPYLITQFIGNINNFNVIFFLTGGGPDITTRGITYGRTDLLITWLYDLTLGGSKQEYAIGSAIGIIVFLISAFISLVMYSKSSANVNEDEFQ